MNIHLPSRIRPLLYCLCLAACSAPALAAPTHPTTRDVVQLSAALDTDAATPAMLGLPARTQAPAMAPAPAAAPVANSSSVQKILQRAITLLGIPYRWGGTTTAGFDCSGLVGYVFRTALGLELPRVSREMASRGERVSREELVEGDLVFFGHGGGINHVGIYVGGGNFLHAPRTGRDVTISSMSSGYWAQHFMSARRVATR